MDKYFHLNNIWDMMKINYMLVLFTWTKCNVSGGNDNINSIEGGQRGPCSLKSFVTTSISNLTSWVVSLS